MSQSTNPTNHRYMGSRPYRDDPLDRLLFFGRDDESTLLLHKILAEDVVLLYAKSGVGKTSLINAGVLQELRRRLCFPAMLRVSNKEPVRSLQRQLKAQAADDVEFIGGEERETLAEFFGGLEIWWENERLRPVLVLDQFEELFTSCTDAQQALIVAELARLLRRRGPEGERIISGPKLVFSVREDFYGEMEAVAEKIPQLMQNRVRLTPLTTRQAEEAIREPASVRDDRLATSPYRYTNEAVRRMLEFLTMGRRKRGEPDRDEVEPFQLQILCFHLEHEVVPDRQGGGGAVWIHAADLGSDARMNGILQRFYQGQILKFDDPRQRQAAQKICEKALIGEGSYRLRVDAGEIRRKYRVGEKFLQKLVDLRLVRVQRWLGGRKHLELSHDSLVEPILAARRQREAAYERARGLLDRGQPALAVKEIDRASSEGVENARLLQLHGQALAALGDYTGAIERYQEALKKSPKNGSIHADLGDAYSSDRRLARSPDSYERAVDAYETAQALAPKNAHVHRKLALLHIEEGGFDRALAAFDRAIKRGAAPGAIYEDLVKALRARGADHAARLLCRQALEVKSKDSTYFYNLAYELDELGDYESALDAWERSFDRRNPDPATLLNWGVTLGNLGRHEEAMEKFDRVLELDSEYAAAAYFNRGETLLELRRYEDSIAESAKALEINDGYAPAFVNWGYALASLGRHDQAIEKYRRALEIDARNVDALVDWAESLGLTGRHEEAVTIYRRLLELEPESTEHLGKLAAALADAGMLGDAEGELEKALHVDPGNARLRGELGWILYRAGRYEDSIRASRLALHLHPRDVRIRSHVALALLRLGRGDEALEECEALAEEAADGQHGDELREGLEHLRELLADRADLPRGRDLLERLEAAARGEPVAVPA